jgi:hypothetical protein
MKKGVKPVAWLEVVLILQRTTRSFMSH